MNKARFLKTVTELGQIGWVEDVGLTRVTFSTEFIEGRNYIAQLMSAAGMQVHIDSVGNIFGKYSGHSNSSKTILTGSHIDSVYGGGIHDGFLGVLSAIEAARSLYESNQLENSLEVVGFNAEEGSPLGGTFGSRSFCGDFSQIPAADVLAQYNIDKEDIYAAKGAVEDYKAFVELHIEQGPVLWRNNLDIGIPTAIVGITRYKVTLTGQANHAGTTPMQERKDAMRAAARLITDWYALTDSLSEQNFVCNIGTISLTPNEAPVVPGKTEFTLEMRSTDAQVITMLTGLFAQLLNNAELPAKMEKIIDKPPVKLYEPLQHMIKDICDTNKLQSIYMPSGAGHDASPLAFKMPAAMMFIPSINGISHAKEESSSEESILLGVQVLEELLNKLDKTEL